MQSPVKHFEKTRLAPTPSGFLHLGNVLSFAITVALAQENGAKILLRIDDLDQARADKKYIQDIFDTLEFLEIPWDEGPRDIKEFESAYSQLYRLDMYNEALKKLSDNGLVFACTCSRKQVNENHSCECLSKNIPLNTRDASWRLIIRDNTELEAKNYTDEIIHASLPAEMQNFVVKKKDGFPSYQLASVMDDLFYGIDLVVRGEDLWPSTLAQHELASVLGQNDFTDITFYHHPLLTELSGKKLSKSAGATSVRHLRESGYKPGNIYSLIAEMLGIHETIADWQQLAGMVKTK